jgi:hypothetical protein
MIPQTFAANANFFCRERSFSTIGTRAIRLATAKAMSSTAPHSTDCRSVKNGANGACQSKHPSVRSPVARFVSYHRARWSLPSKLPLATIGSPLARISDTTVTFAKSTSSPVAQLVEQAAVNRLVAGSSPAGGADLKILEISDNVLNARWPL